MKPSLGRIVLVPIAAEANNGATEAPAVITRVWSEHPDGWWVINVKVIADSAVNMPWLTSVRLFDTAERALLQGSAHVAYWPPRI